MKEPFAFRSIDIRGSWDMPMDIPIDVAPVWKWVIGRGLVDDEDQFI